MKIQLINNTASEEFKKVIDLGDNNSKTLGFLPYQVFKNSAKQKKIIGAFDKVTNEFFGYLLYRVSYNKVTIVHCCISPEHRGKKVAVKLVDYLKKNTKQYDGIKLSCRNSYNINAVWERMNFVPIKEKKGRSKEGYLLTIWWYPHSQNDLLSLISDYELSNKIVAVMDMNIFLDIKDKREKESLALNSDWLLGEAILYLTREINVEINRAKSQKERKINRNLLAYYEILPFKDEESFRKILEELKEYFPIKNTNDQSDLKHLAYSISGGAQFFITRDTNLLKNKEIFQKYNLSIYRPSEFITFLDESLQVSKYMPQSLIGTNMSTERVNTGNIEYYTKIFLKPKERKSHLQKIIRDSLSQPKKYELTTITKDNNVLAFIILDRSIEGKLTIPVFRFLTSDLKITLSKHLLFKAILNSTEGKITLIEITEDYLDLDIVKTIEEARFIKTDNTWKKYNILGVLKEKAISNKILIDTNSGNQFEAQKIIDKLVSQESSDFFKTYNKERYLSPLKIKDFNIPTYIVPIRPYWAEQLFEDKSIEKLPLYEPQYELLLNRENVYYRSASPKVIQSPSRILWYLSENKSTKTKGHIKACSYIDEVFIDTPKNLYKQFKQLGIYEFRHVKETAKKNDELMAFVFSDTELFKRHISLKKIKDLFIQLENKNFMAVTPIKINSETYIALYKFGMEL